MATTDQEYWIQLLDKLNASEDIDAVSGEILEDLCHYFQFGVGFIYEVDYRGDYHLTKLYETYENNLPKLIERRDALSPQEEQAIIAQKMVYFRNGVFQSDIDTKMSALLNARSMVMVPVRSDKGDMLAAVGILDRRGKVRNMEEDIAFTKAVLTTLGTYIKMKMYQTRVERTQQSLEDTLNHMGVDVYVNDFETHEILYLNKSMAAPYGGVEKMIGQTCWKALYNDKTGECEFCPKPHLLDEEGKPTKIYGWDYQRPFDGAWFRVLSGAFPWMDGRMAQVVSSVDITENKTNEELIRRAAEYDMLTNLPNRARLIVDMENALERLEKKGCEGYVLFMDLDGFKAVNDTLGHEVGDELLTTVGAFLQASPLTRDRSYRYGGDEFVIFCTGDDCGPLEDVIDYLRSGFVGLWKLKEHEVHCGTSIGISCYPSDGTLASQLVRYADQAMYESKKVGTGAVHMYNKGKPVMLAQYSPGEKMGRV